MRKTYIETDEFYKQYAAEKNRYWAQMPMDLIENYIYLYHLGQYIILPDFPDKVNDQQQPMWQSTSPLLRTAPIQSYTGNDARKIIWQGTWHRDMMNDLNATNYSGIVDAAGFSSDEDYVDRAIKLLQAAQLPVYGGANRMVSPPIVAMRIGNEIYIKGVLEACGITYNLPMLRNGKYASIDVALTVKETEPFDAEMIAQLGSFRTSKTLNRNIYSFKYDTPQRASGSSGMRQSVLETR